MNLINIIKIHNQIGMIVVDQIDIRESNYTKTDVSLISFFWVLF
jgi:hypothetical protein